MNTEPRQPPADEDDAEQRVALASRETAEVLRESAEIQRDLAGRLDRLALALLSLGEPPFSDLERRRRR